MKIDIHFRAIKRSGTFDYIQNFYRLITNIMVILIFLNLISITFGAHVIQLVTAEVDKDVLGSSPGRFNSIVSYDIDDDGRHEIVFGNYDGYITVLEYRDGDFFEEWQSPKFGHRVWGITVADFLGDSGNEIIAGNGDGELIVYDAKTHNKVWFTDKFGDEDLVRDIHGLFVHDLGKEGERYLIAGTGYKNDKDLGTIYIFKANGTKNVDYIVKIEGIDNRLRGIGVGDVDADSKLELVFGSGVTTGERPGEGYIRIYNIESLLNKKSNSLEWKSRNLKGDCVALELMDFTGDGYPDIVVGNGYRYQAGWVRIIAYNKDTNQYEEYWKSANDPDIGPKPYGLAVGDIDKDGRLEIVVGNQAGYIYIYEQSGSSMNLEWRSRLLGSDILGIDLDDVDDDGQIEIIAAQGGYTGKGDYTSCYTDPHIYIIDGSTHRIEKTIGETSFWQAYGLPIVALFLTIIFLIVLNLYMRFRKRFKELSEAKEPQQTITSTSTKVRSRPPNTPSLPNKSPPNTSKLNTQQSTNTIPTPASKNKPPAPQVNDPFPKSEV